MILISSNWLIFFPLAIALYVAQKLTLAQSDQGQRTWIGAVFHGLILTMLWFALMGFMMRWSLVSLIWLPIIFLFGTIYVWQRRRLARVAMLSSMTMPLNFNERQTLLSYYVDENRGYVRELAKKLQRDCGKSPWGWVLEFHHVAKGLYEKLGLRLQHMYGFTSEELKACEAISPLAVEGQIQRLLGRLLVLFWSILIFPVLYLFMIFVMPTVLSIAQEFNWKVPESWIASLRLVKCCGTPTGHSY